jgi:hypothetical protein
MYRCLRNCGNFVVCKRGGEVSLTRVQIPADAVLCYRFEFESQSGSEALMALSIAAFKAVNPGSIPG